MCFRIAVVFWRAGAVVVRVAVTTGRARVGGGAGVGRSAARVWNGTWAAQVRMGCAALGCCLVR